MVTFAVVSVEWDSVGSRYPFGFDCFPLSFGANERGYGTDALIPFVHTLIAIEINHDGTPTGIRLQLQLSWLLRVHLQFDVDAFGLLQHG